MATKSTRKRPIQAQNRRAFNTDILNLFNFMNNNNNDDESYDSNKSCILDISSMINIWKLIYNGLDEICKEKLDNETKLKHILKLAPKSTQYRLGLFIRNNYDFKQEYLTKFQDTVVLDKIPLNSVELKRINKIIDGRFKDWDLSEKKFFTKPLMDFPLYIKDQSCFNVKWKFDFDNDSTLEKPFYIGNDKQKKINTMVCYYLQADKYISKKLDTLFLSIPYEDDNHSLLIIMPQTPHTKEQLMYFCNHKLSENDISEFINCKESTSMIITFPKCQFESRWELSNRNEYEDMDQKCKFFTMLLNPSNTFGSISNNLKGFDEITIESTSNTIFNETGTTVVTESSALAVDGHLPEINIDKNFVFMIMNKDFLISKIGMIIG